MTIQSEWFFDATTSDLSPTWNSTSIDNLEILQTDPADSGNFSYNIPASSTRSIGFITPSTLPNSDNWPNIVSSDNVKFYVINTTMDLRARARVHMLNSSGTILESSSFGSWVTLDGVNRSPASSSLTWTTTELCSYRLAFEVEVENMNSMKDIAFECAYSNDASSNDSSIFVDMRYDTATCTAGATFVPKCIVF